MRSLFIFFAVVVSRCVAYAQNPELVADIAPFPQASSPGPFCEFNNKLYFAANRYNASSPNRELFVTDGTPSGTQLFKELVTGNNGSSPDNFIVLNGKMYFTVYNQFANTAFEIPYVSDGTPEGTFPLSLDPDVAVIGGNVQAARFIFVPLGQYVYFQSYAPDFPYHRVLYRTDGTPSATQIVVTMPNNSNAPTLMQGPMKLGNKLLFTSQINGEGSNLYRYDPTNQSVSMVRANTNLYPQYGWAEYDGKVFFTGNNLFDLEQAAEPWVTDGTSAGTFEIANLNTTFGEASAPGSYEVMDGKLFFLARVNGSANTVTLFSLTSGNLPAAVAEIGGPTLSYTHSYLYQDAGRLYFKGEDATHGAEPWQSDGTANGTGMIADIWPGASDSMPQAFVRYCNDMYFTAGIPSGTSQALYKTDGTSAGTTLIPGLADNPMAYGSGVTHKAVLADQLYFAAQYDVNAQTELYRYDAQCSLAAAEFAPVETAVFPNPSSDGRFAIVGANGSGIAVFDVLGRSIPVEKIGTGLFQICPESGMYLVKTNVGSVRLLVQP